MFRRLASLLRVLFSRRDFEDGMADELRFHLEQYTDDLVRSGMAPAEAARRARLEFGSLDAVKEDCRQARGLRLFDELRRELRHAARLLRKAPGFTATALGTLALCLGANLTIFAVVDAVLLRPAAVSAADRLVTVYNTIPRRASTATASSMAELLRAPRPDRRLRVRIATLPPWHAIVGREPARPSAKPVTRGLSGVLLDVSGRRRRWDAPSPTRRRPTQTDRVVDPHRRLLAASASTPTPTCSGRRSASTECRENRGGRPAARFPLSVLRGADLLSPLASRPEDRTPDEPAFRRQRQDMIARLEPGATLAEAQAQIDAQNAAHGGDRSNPQG